MIWQFFGGMANLIGNFALIRLVIELTDGMDYEYGISILITTTIPLMFAIPRMIDGVSRGGGMLAWNLGHNDFANRHMVPLYMGIHVTLTGVRGFFAPYLAMIMLYGWKSDAVPGLTLPPFAGIGPHVFLFTTVLALIAEVGFIRLSRDISRKQADKSKGE